MKHFAPRGGGGGGITLISLKVHKHIYSRLTNTALHVSLKNLANSPKIGNIELQARRKGFVGIPPFSNTSTVANLK